MSRSVGLTGAERAAVTAPLERAWTLPPRMYTSAEVFDLEVERLFRHEWICVARTEQLVSGTYRAVSVFDQPVVLTRGADDEIRALSNVCLHRAMPIADGAGSGTVLTCPYHLWSYGLDGQLRTAPLMDDVVDFDPAGCALPSLPCEVWEGFVFVNLDPDAPPLKPQLTGLADRIAGWTLGELEVLTTIEYPSPWNWKILVENFMEAYHHIGPHRTTFQPHHPARESSVCDNGGQPWCLLTMPGDGDLDEPDGLPFLPHLPRDDRSLLVAAAVYPTLLFALTGSAAVWYELDVRAVDDMTLRIHFLVPPEVAADAEMQEAVPLIEAGLREIHEEDIAVNEGPWRGLHAPTAAQGRLSTYERAIWQLNQLWVDRMEA